MAKKKPQRKTTPRNVIRIVWLDAADQKLFNRLPHLAWTADKTDAFAQALRYVYFHLKKFPNAYKRFVRPSPGVWGNGTDNCMRMTQREHKALERCKKTMGLDSLAETIRTIIRMASEYFEE